MRKVFFVLLAMVLWLGKVFAYSYSPWSMDYPSDVNEKLIEKEVRYKWYKENYVNIEYLSRDDFGDKSYDLNDYIFSDYSEYSEEYVSESDDVEVVSSSVSVSNSEEFNRIVISGVYGRFNIDEISITNGNSILSTTINSDSFDGGLLNNNETYDYVSFGEGDSISVLLPYKCRASNVSITIYSQADEPCSYMVSYYLDDNMVIYINKSTATGTRCGSTIKYNSNNPNFKFIATRNITMYSYRTKLYKTYDVEREYTNDYLSNMDGYIKDEEKSKIFYRYINSQYIIVDIYNNIVYDNNKCSKNICFSILTESLNPKKSVVENPQTGDSINIYVVIMILSIFFVIICEKYIRKCRMN